MKSALSLGLMGTLFNFAEALRGADKVRSMISKVMKNNEEDKHQTTSLVAGMFDVSGFDGSFDGAIGMKVMTQKGKQIHMSKLEQTNNWYSIDEEESSLVSGQWMPAKNGFRFKGESEDEAFSCQPRAGATKKDALVMSFSCSEASKSEKARFAQVEETFWKPCPDGHVPYGWKQEWGTFDFPFYAVVPDGYLGCTYVSEDGYCYESESTPGSALHTKYGYNDSADSKPVTLYVFGAFGADDLLKGSHYSAETDVHEEAAKDDSHQAQAPPAPHETEETHGDVHEDEHEDEHTEPTHEDVHEDEHEEPAVHLQEVSTGSEGPGLAEQRVKVHEASPIEDEDMITKDTSATEDEDMITKDTSHTENTYEDMITKDSSKPSNAATGSVDFDEA